MENFSHNLPLLFKLHDVRSVKAKMHQIRFAPQTPLGSLQCSPDFLAGFKGAYF